MTTRKLTAVPDVDLDIFAFNNCEHDHWLAINSISQLTKYYEDDDDMHWRLTCFANLIKGKLDELPNH